MTRVILLTLTLYLVASSFLFAQGPHRQDREKIRAAHIAFITERLDLSPEQAEKFWPVFNEFRDKRQELNQEFNQKRRDIDRQTSTDDEKRKLINEHLSMKQAQLDLEKEYSDKFLKVLTPDQLIQLQRAEEDFRGMLINRLQKRNRDQGRDGRGQPGMMN